MTESEVVRFAQRLDGIEARLGSIERRLKHQHDCNQSVYRMLDLLERRLQVESALRRIGERDKLLTTSREATSRAQWSTFHCPSVKYDWEDAS